MQSAEELGGPPQSVVLGGELRRRLITLALPAVGEQSLNYCVSLFDTFLAGQMRHEGIEVGLATSAVGIAAYLDWLATLLFALIGTGTTALVARFWGAGEFQQAKRFTNQSITLAGGLGVVVFILFYTLAPGYAQLQQMSGESYRIVVHFLRTVAVGQIFFGVCLIGSAALRGRGDMRTPMLVLGLVNIINMIVSSGLVFGIGPIQSWGIDGIATGTLVARIAGGLLMLAALAGGWSGLKLEWNLLTPRLEDVRRIVRIGAPAAVDGALLWTGHSLFLMIIARLDVADAGTGAAGKANLAAHIIAMQVEGLTYLPAAAWAYAAATMVGQSLGAGDEERARRTGQIAARQAGAIAAAGSLVYLVGSPWIYRAMTSEPAVWEVGIPAFRFLALYQVPLAMMVVYLNAMRGAGDTRSPLVVNLLGIMLVRLPLGYLFGVVLGGGLIGAWAGMFIDVSLRSLAAGLWYAQGRWAKHRV